MPEQPGLIPVLQGPAVKFAASALRATPLYLSPIAALPLLRGIAGVASSLPLIAKSSRLFFVWYRAIGS
jgi:hypothetical protein